MILALDRVLFEAVSSSYLFKVLSLNYLVKSGQAVKIGAIAKQRVSFVAMY